MLIGAICGTLLLSITLHRAVVPHAVRALVQISSGTLIGCSVNREDIIKLRQAYKVIFAVLVAFLTLNIVGGELLAKIFSIEPLTAMMCMIPGGMNDVPIIAADMGAELSTVVLLQFVRQCAGLGVFPAWIKWIGLRRGKKAKPIINTGNTQSEKRFLTKQIIMVFAISTPFGIAGNWLGIPAGALTFAIIGTLAAKTLKVSSAFPKPLKKCTQVMAGCYIGCLISYESLLEIKTLFIPAIFAVGLYMLNSYLVGEFLHRKFSIPIEEAMLMMTPAGASDVALISSDIGVQSPLLVVVQISRMLSCVVIFPQICAWLT